FVCISLTISSRLRVSSSSYFFFPQPPPTHIYTLSLHDALPILSQHLASVALLRRHGARDRRGRCRAAPRRRRAVDPEAHERESADRKSTRLNSSHDQISYAVFCLKKKNT